MVAVTTFGELGDALSTLAHCDLILVDTPGYSPWGERPTGIIDPERYHEFDEDFDVEINICLSATTRTEDLVSKLEAFSALAPRGIVFTKIDEASGVGCMLSAAMSSGLPITHVCHGHNVPDDISAPTGQELARWIRTAHPHGVVKPDTSRYIDAGNALTADLPSVAAATGGESEWDSLLDETLQDLIEEVAA